MERSVRDVMTGWVIAAAGDASLADDRQLMRDHDVGAGGLARLRRSA
jgi:CBS-domain-containing membrane protein